jgi:hypothetical protein
MVMGSIYASGAKRTNSHGEINFYDGGVHKGKTG